MQVTRRRWLKGMVATAATTAVAAEGPGLAAQVYVWTQYLRKENKTLKDGLEDIIAGTRAAGYESAELMYTFFEADVRERTMELLKTHELGVPIVYNGGAMHEEASAEKTIAQSLELAGAVRPLGTRILNVNPSPKPNRERKTDSELDIQAKAVRRLAAELKKKDVELILHHHDPEMAEHAREWNYLLEHTDVGLCVDTMWVARGGEDPMGILRKAGKRLVSVHLRNMRNGVCTEEFGDGDIDYRQCASYMGEMRFRGWLVVELFHEDATKVTRSLEENLRLSRRYTEEVFGL